MNGYESLLGQTAYRSPSERSYIDKLLSRREVEELKNLVGKDNLSKKELSKFLYLITSIELKLANFNEMDRYVLGKFFAWIREFIMLSEFTYDYVEKLEKELAAEKKADKDADTKDKDIIIATIEEVKVQQMHNLKFIVDVYLYLIRSTMALGSVTFDQLSKNRYEYEYAPNQLPPPEATQTRGGLWPFRR